MKSLRILHLTKSVGLYGADRVILNLFRSFNRDRFDICVASLVDPRRPHRELLDEIQRQRGETIAIECTTQIDSRSIRTLIAILKERNIQVLHCHEMKSRLYGLIAGKYLHLPLVTTNHNWIRENILVGAYELLDAFYLRFFDHIIAVSEDVQRTLLKARIHQKRISLVINGINMPVHTNSDHHSDTMRRALHIPPNAPVIGAVGRLSKEKGFHRFLDAAQLIAAEAPAARFLIAGDGPLKTDLLEYSRAVGLENKVLFLGFRPDIMRLYPLMDVFVLTSLREGTPMALLEAMAMRIPVVATAVGGVPQIVRDNHNGRLLQSHGARVISEAILHLLRNPAEAERLATNGEATVKNRYSAEAMARSYEAIYDILTNAARDPRPTTRW